VTLRPQTHAESQSGTELVFAIWRRRKWLAIVVFLTTATAAVSFARWLPDLYRATSSVLIERQQVSEAFVRPSVTAELETRIQMMRQEIMSRARLSDLITRLNLYQELREREPLDVAVERMRRDIVLDLKGVNPSNGRTETIAFTLSYTGRDPATVARVANELASLYVEENTRIRGRQATRTAEFLRAQLDSVKTELDEQERLANEFKLRHSGELPQQMEANLSSLERLNTQLRLNGDNQMRAMDRRERLERQLADVERAPASRGPAVTAVSALAARQRELTELRQTFTDEYPDVIRVRDEVARLQRQVADSLASDDDALAHVEQTRQRARQGLADVGTELASLKEEERALRQAILAYEQRVENSPRRQQEFLELSRGSQATSERYYSLLKRYEEAQLAETLEQGASVEQFRILDVALPPRDVAAPNRIGLVILGLVLAAGLAVGAMIGRERLDHALHSVDDLRRFAVVPVFVSIPAIVTRADTSRRRWQRALTTVSVMVCLALVVAGVRYVAQGNETIVRLMTRS
jgi:polysaccharide chain length determinant protein (PEP-CTERM system associated)